MSPKILVIDIETSPNLAHVWSLWNQNVGLSQLREASEVMCFAAKWYAEEDVLFFSTFRDGTEDMVYAAHDLLDEADIVVTYNGIKFDIPHLNRTFLEWGLTPPSPYKQVDLYRTVKRQFLFPSNKLDYVSQFLELGEKLKHEGHQLWVDCLSGDEDAWDRMQRYNEQDVLLTEDLYTVLRPWITTHPTVGLYDAEPSDEPSCPTCGSTSLQRRGKAFTSVSTYQRYQCQSCGKWSRGGQKVTGIDVRHTS